MSLPIGQTAKIDVAALLKELFAPRRVCICGDFEQREVDHRFYGYKCKCGGWMSVRRLIEGKDHE